MTRIGLAAAILALSAATANAESKAEALFKKGKQLLSEKSYSAACEAFEESDRLEPAIGTKLNAAKCYEEWGRLTKALRWYQEAEEMAKKSKDDRLPKIKELIGNLDADIPRLTVKLPPDAKNAGVKLDGAPLDTFDKEIMLDPGPHEIQYQANGETRTKTIQLERGSAREITLEIPLPTSDNKDKKPPPPKQIEPEDPGKWRRIAAYSMVGAGALGIGIASYLTLDARSTYKEALNMHCGGMTNGCNEDGLRITGDARSQANTATIITIASLAVAAGGVVLYLTAPKAGSGERSDDEEDEEAMYFAPMVGPGTGGIVFGGRY